MYLQDVALLNGYMLQLTGLVLQPQGGAADGQVGHHLLWDSQRALTQLHGLHLLLEALHIGQKTLQKQDTLKDNMQIKQRFNVFFLFWAFTCL